MAALLISSAATAPIAVLDKLPALATLLALKSLTSPRLLPRCVRVFLSDQRYSDVFSSAGHRITLRRQQPGTPR